ERRLARDRLEGLRRVPSGSGHFGVQGAAEIGGRVRELRLDAMLALARLIAVSTIGARKSAFALAAAPVAAPAAPAAPATRPIGVAAPLAVAGMAFRAAFCCMLGAGVRVLAALVCDRVLRLGRHRLRTLTAFARLAFLAAASSSAASAAATAMAVLAFGHGLDGLFALAFGRGFFAFFRALGFGGLVFARLFLVLEN